MPLMTDAEVRQRLAGLEARYHEQARQYGQQVLDIRTLPDAQLEAIDQRTKEWEASTWAGRPVMVPACDAAERILAARGLSDSPLPPYTGPEHHMGQRLEPRHEWIEGMPLGIWWGR